MEDFFPSLCTIQENLGIQDAHGVVVDDWQDVADHVDIPCAHGPSKGNEVKLPDQTYVISNYTLSLRGYYPTITEKMQAVVTGPNAGTYEILLAQSSSHGVVTRLLTRMVT
jgi:hypothetical protein